MNNPMVDYMNTARDLNKFLSGDSSEAVTVNEALSTVPSTRRLAIKTAAVELLVRGTFGNDGYGDAVRHAVASYHAYGRK